MFSGLRLTGNDSNDANTNDVSNPSDDATLLDIGVGSNGPSATPSDDTPTGEPAPTATPTLTESGATTVMASSVFAPPTSTPSRYEIVREHARGGMGQIFLAVDNSVGRKVALKRLIAGIGGHTTSGSAGSSGIADRFMREAKLTGRLEHPNIVPVYELGTDEKDNLFYTMRFVGGATMGHRLKEIKNSIASRKNRLQQRLELLDSFVDVCNAIAYAHSKGVIHRDIKPSNVMLGEFGETVVLDWGLARVLDEEESKRTQFPTAKHDGDSSHLTMDGAVIGTPAYMPPEQADGDATRVDKLSDVYSLGAVLYELLTGGPPYAGANAQAVVSRVRTGPPTDVQEVEPLAPPELVALCKLAMARDKDQRLASAQQLAAEIKAFRDGKSLESYEYSTRELLARFMKRHWKFVAVAVVALTAVGVVSAVAVGEIVAERNNAETALHEAQEAEAARKLAEKDAESKAAEILKSRQTAMQRVDESLKGIDPEPLLRDLNLKLETYASDSNSTMVMTLNERQQNRALISSILGYLAQVQEWVRLREVSHSKPTEKLKERKRVLSETHRLLVELAVVNADFELAEYLLSSGELAADEKQVLRDLSADTESRLKRWRAVQITLCFEDLRTGLRDADRSFDAPTKDDYVTQLSGFRDSQTLQMLTNELLQLSIRIGTREATPTIDDADFCEVLVRSLALLGFPTDASPAIASFLSEQHSSVMIEPCVKALVSLKHIDASLALLDICYQRGVLFLESYRKAIARLEPNHPRIKEQPKRRAAILYARFQNAKVIQDYGSSSDPDVMLLVALSYIRTNAPDKAATVLRQLESGLWPDIISTRLMETNEAVEALTECLKNHPNNESIYIELVHRSGRARPYAARDAATKLTTLRAGEYKYWHMLGNVHASLSHHQDAADAFSKATDLNPDAADSWVGLAESQQRIPGYFTPAAQRATELSPNNPRALRLLCMAHYFEMRFDEAIEAGKRAIRHPDPTGESHYWLALSYLRITHDPRGEIDVFNAHASHPEERKNIESALAVMQKCRDKRYRGFIADLLIALGRYSEAKELILIHHAKNRFDTNVRSWGDNSCNRALAIIHALTNHKPDPTTFKELCDSSLALANHAFHEFDSDSRMKLCQRSYAALVAAEEQHGPEPNLAQKLQVRRCRLDLASAMRRGRIWDGVVTVLSPLMKELPEWDTFRVEALLIEARIALGQQYLNDAVLFFAATDQERKQRAQTVDAMTGTERKRLGNELIDKNFDRATELSKQGFQARDAWLTPSIRALENHPKAVVAAQAARDFGSAQTEISVHPYAVPVIVGVKKLLKAHSLGMRTHDVVHSVNGVRVRSFRSFVEEMNKSQSSGEPVKLVIHRYSRDEKGLLIPVLNAQGEPITDEFGNPKHQFESISYDIDEGPLGITVTQGFLPHPMNE